LNGGEKRRRLHRLRRGEIALIKRDVRVGIEWNAVDSRQTNQLSPKRYERHRSVVKVTAARRQSFTLVVPTPA
jgi:hypothetical protein